MAIRVMRFIKVIRVVFFFSCNWIEFLGFRIVIVIKVVKAFRNFRIIGVIRVIAGNTDIAVIMSFSKWGV